MDIPDSTAYAGYFTAIAKTQLGIEWYHTKYRHQSRLAFNGEVFVTTLSFKSQFRDMTTNMASQLAVIIP